MLGTAGGVIVVLVALVSITVEHYKAADGMRDLAQSDAAWVTSSMMLPLRQQISSVESANALIAQMAATKMEDAGATILPPIWTINALGMSALNHTGINATLCTLYEGSCDMVACIEGGVALSMSRNVDTPPPACSVTVDLGAMPGWSAVTVLSIGPVPKIAVTLTTAITNASGATLGMIASTVVLDISAFAKLATGMSSQLLRSARVYLVDQLGGWILFATTLNFTRSVTPVSNTPPLLLGAPWSNGLGCVFNSTHCLADTTTPEVKQFLDRFKPATKYHVNGLLCIDPVLDSHTLASYCEAPMVTVDSDFGLVAIVSVRSKDLLDDLYNGLSIAVIATLPLLFTAGGVMATIGFVLLQALHELSEAHTRHGEERERDDIRTLLRVKNSTDAGVSDDEEETGSAQDTPGTSATLNVDTLSGITQLKEFGDLVDTMHARRRGSASPSNTFAATEMAQRPENAKWNPTIAPSRHKTPPLYPKDGIVLAEDTFTTLQEDPNSGFPEQATEFDFGIAWLVMRRSAVSQLRGRTTVRRCSMLYIRATEMALANIQHTCVDIINVVSECEGTIEWLRPDEALVSFGAHATLVSHEQSMFRCAQQLREVLSYDTAVITLDTCEINVGVYGNDVYTTRSIWGPPIRQLRMLSMVPLPPHTGLIVTQRVVAVLNTELFVPFDVVQHYDGPVVVLYTIDDRAADPAVFKEAFAQISLGRTVEALQTLKAITRPTNVKQHLISLCKSHKNYPHPYLRCEASNPWSGSSNEVLDDRVVEDVASPLTHSDEANYVVPTLTKTGAARIKTDHRKYSRVQSSHEVTEEKLQHVSRQLTSASPYHTSSPLVVVADENPLFEMMDLGPSDLTVPSLVDPPFDFTDNSGLVWIRSSCVIGVGASAAVYRGLSPTGTVVAMKVFNVHDRKFDLERLAAEGKALSLLHHPNIVSFHGLLVNQNFAAIVEEFVPGGSLADVQKNFAAAGLPPKVIKRFANDILAGIEYLHENGTVHCDIKPHNVLLGLEGHCKISDFGVALQSTPSLDTRGSFELRGTPLYMSPEVARGEEPITASDIWSFGCTLLELLTNAPPLAMRLRSNIDVAVLTARLGKSDSDPECLRPVIPTSLEPSAQMLLEACLRSDPYARPTASELLRHAYFL